MSKKRPFTSIIMTAYDTNQLNRQITTAAIEAIIKYTDESSYEFILMDTIPENHTMPLDFKGSILETSLLGKRKDRLWFTLDCSKEKNPGYYGMMNIGASIASGDYFCFMQNDVIVPEGWLKGLTFYLDNDIADVVWPDQQPKTREWMESKMMVVPGTPEDQGAREAGMVLMRKSTFEQVGGWDSNYRMFYGEKDMILRVGNMCRLYSSGKVSIIHLDSATYFGRMITEPEKQREDINISGFYDQKWQKK